MRWILEKLLNAGLGMGRAMRMVPRRLARSALLIVLAGVLALGGYYVYRAARESLEATRTTRTVNARVTIEEETATVRLVFDIVGPGTISRKLVPIVPPGVSVIEARLDGEAAELDLLDGRPALVVGGGGRRSAELVYALPLPRERHLELALPRGVRTTVEVEIATPGMTVEAAPPAIVEMLPAEDKTVAKIITPPVDGLAITWFPRPDKVSTPVRTGARTETLYTIQGDSLCGRTVYSLRVQGEDVLRLTFGLPGGVSVDQVEGGWIEGWDVSDEKLLVQAARAVTGELTMTVHHRRPLAEGKVGLEVPVLENAARQWGFGAVAAGGAVELKELSVENGCEIDPRGLPDSLRSAGSAPVARAFRYDGVPSRHELQLVRHKEMETLEATADSLNGLLVYASDGRAVGKMVYSVRNVRRQHLVVTMPPGAELWSVYVAGAPVRPSKTDDDKFLIPLSCSAATARKAFSVEIVYFVQGTPFGDKGKYAAVLPEVDVPVMQVMLSVSVPEEISLEDFGGNLRVVETFAFSLAEQDMSLVREAGKAKPGDVDLRGVNDQLDEQIRRGQRGQMRLRLDYSALERNAVFQEALRFNKDNRAFMQQYFLENGAVLDQEARTAPTLNLTGFGQDELAEITGLASLKIAVPAGGRLLRFERQFLFNESASVEADYWSSLAANGRAKGEARFKASVAALYTLDQRGMRLAARVEFEIYEGKVDSLRFELPAGAKVLTLTAQNIAAWEAKEGSLEVRLVRPERSGGSLLLTAEFDEAGLDRLELVAPRLEGARCEEKLVAVTAPVNYQMTFPEFEKLERLAASELPPELRRLLAGSGQPTVFRLGRLGPDRVRAEVVIHKVRLDSTTATLYTLSPGGLELRAHMSYSLDVGKVDSLAFELPAGARVISVKSPNVAAWQVEGSSLKVRLLHPEATGGDLLLNAEFDQADLGKLELTPVRLEDARREESLVAVTAPSSFELRFPDLGRLERVPASALPNELREGVNGRLRPIAFRVGRARGTRVSLETVTHEELPSLRMTCDSVNAISFYTREGMCVTRVIYEIRNVGQRHLELCLPAGSKLWGAFVADRAVRALQGIDGKMLVPLEYPSAGEVRSFPVEVVYTRTGKPLERKGTFETELPKLSIPVMHAMYSVYLPKRLRLGRFGGTLRQVREFSASIAPTAVSRDRAAPKQALKVLEQRNQVFDRQAALEWNVSQRAVQKMLDPVTRETERPRAGAGVLPACALKIYIPAVGQLLRFERHLVVEGKMSVTCSYRA